jgi:hypothetical protein
MKRLFPLLALLLVLAVPGLALATDAAVTFTEYKQGPVKLIAATWVGNSTANATGTTGAGHSYNGEIMGFRWVDSTTNATVNATLTDASGLDVLQGAAQNMHNATDWAYSEQVNGTQGSTSKFLPVVGQLTFTVSPPFTGTGTAYFWIR